MKIAFDITGTLLRTSEEETKAMIVFLKILKNAGHTIIVWSGDDLDTVNRFIEKYVLKDFVDFTTSKLSVKPENFPDIAFDDSEFGYLGKLATIKV